MKLVLSLLLSALPLMAVRPDLQLKLLSATTATGASRSIDLRDTGLYFHTVTVSPAGTVSTCTIAFEESDDDGVADAFANLTAIGGTSNPYTCTTGGTIHALGFKRYLRVNLSVLTGGGNITAMLTSFNADPTRQQVEGTAGVSTASVGNPVFTAGYDDGGTIRGLPVFVAGGAATAASRVMLLAGLGSNIANPIIACDTNVAVNTTTVEGTEQLVALTSAQKIYLCAYAFSIGAAGNFKFVRGTGTNCGTGQADLTDVLAITTNQVVNQGNGLGALLNTPAAEALCLTVTGGTVTGFIRYAKSP